uniref:Uncharacterized protein n=1 Tax=Angiostrongylus cantonensis TaxID=6313 RepID=A0A0K0D168_ANGCA
MVLSIGRFPRPSLTVRLLELRVTMDGFGRHDKLREPLTLFVPFLSVGPNVTFLRRSSWSDLGIEISNDDLEECMVFSVEPLHVHVERFDFSFVIV